MKTLLDGVDMWKRKAAGNGVIDYSFHIAVTDPGEAVL